MDNQLSFDLATCRNLLQAIDLPAFVVDASGRIVFLNAACERMASCEGWDVAERSIWEVLGPAEGISGVPQAWESLLQEPSVGKRERVWTSDDGAGSIIKWTCRIFAGGDCHNKLILGTGVDLTERRKVERELRDSEDRFLGLVETTNDWIWELDTKANFLYASPRVKDILGYDPEELIGTSGYALMPPEVAEDISAKFDRFVQDEQPFRHLININIAKDGRRVVLESSGRPFYDQDGKLAGYRGSDRDVTDRWQVEKQLHETDKMQAIGRLAGGISHDINNQIGGILGMAELIKLRLNDSALEGFVDDIIKAADRSADLAAQLLAFARQGQYQCRAVDIHRAIREVIAVFRHGSESRIELIEDLQAKHFVTMGDPSQLQNCLLQLALNANDAVAEVGEIRFSTRDILVDAKLCRQRCLSLDSGEYIEIEVSDTGKGMSEEVLKRIFEPFFTTKECGKSSGTGMGLAAVYGTVENHRGAIAVDSSEGEGTTVTLYLVPAEPEADVVAAVHDISTATSARVLLVDDEAILRQAISAGLEDQGCKVECCENGAQAVGLFASDTAFDLVLLDMVMPVMGGAETFHELRKLDPNLNIVIVSGYALSEETQALLDEGAVAFLKKPFPTAKVLELVHLCSG